MSSIVLVVSLGLLALCNPAVANDLNNPAVTFDLSAFGSGNLTVPWSAWLGGGLFGLLVYSAYVGKRKKRAASADMPELDEEYDADLALAMSNIFKQFETLQLEREERLREANESSEEESDVNASPAVDIFLQSDVGSCHRRFVCEVANENPYMEQRLQELSKLLSRSALRMLLPPVFKKPEASPKFQWKSQLTHQALEECRKQNPCSEDKLQLVESFIPELKQLEQS